MNNIKAILISQGLTSKQGQEQLYKLFYKYELMSLITTKFNFKILVVSPHCERINQIIINTLCMWGFDKQNILLSSNYSANEINEMNDILFVYVCEGNTFEVMNYMIKNKWCSVIKNQVMKEDAIYIGASAGAMVATEDITLAKDFDSNFVCLDNFCGLEIVSGTVIPHYDYRELKRYLEHLEEENYAYPVTNIRDDEALIYFDLENRTDKPRRIRIPN